MSGTRDGLSSVTHLSDDALIGYFYGVGEAPEHLAGCSDCQARLQAMKWRRAKLEAATEDSLVDSQLLIAQRRAIYERLSNTGAAWRRSILVRLAPVGAVALALGLGVVTFESNHKVAPKADAVSDAQLAQEVSQLSLEVEAHPTVPLKGLFE